MRKLLLLNGILTMLLFSPWSFAKNDPLQEDIPWDQFSVSVQIKNFVETIAYEQTDLLCYSYGKMIADAKRQDNLRRSLVKNNADPRTLGAIPDFDQMGFWRNFFNDPRFRRSIREWLFINSEAFNQALQNATFKEEEQAQIDARRQELASRSSFPTLTKIKHFVLDTGEANTHSFWSRYTQYIKYLVESEGFKTAIRHCGIRYNLGVEEETEEGKYAELESAMKETLFSYNHTTGLGVGILALTGVAYTGWHVGGFIIRGVMALGRGLKSLYTFLNPHPEPLIIGSSFSLLANPTANQQAMMQEVAQKLNSQQGSFSSLMARIGLTGGLMAELGVEGAFVAYFASELDENIFDNQATQPEPQPAQHAQEAHSRMTDDPLERVKIAWWFSRSIAYERLIDRGLELDWLEHNEPDAPQTFTKKELFQHQIDFYLIDYQWIATRLERRRKAIVNLERQINEMCPPMEVSPHFDRSLLANDPIASSFYQNQSMQDILSLRCRREHQTQLEEMKERLLRMQHSRDYRILRMIYPILQLRKRQLDKFLENENDWPLELKVLFELMERNEHRDYGWCRANITQDKDVPDSYMFPLCRFHWLSTKQKFSHLPYLNVHFSYDELLELQDLTSLLEDYFNSQAHSN